MKDNGFKLTKETRWRYPARTIMDVDYTDDIAEYRFWQIHLPKPKP